MGQSAEQKTLPIIRESPKNNTTAPPAIPTPTARAENCQFNIFAKGKPVHPLRRKNRKKNTIHATAVSALIQKTALRPAFPRFPESAIPTLDRYALYSQF
jgi:hypothetical protein